MTWENLLARLHDTSADIGGYPQSPKAIKSWMDAQPPQPMKTDYLRASGLHSLCPREFVLNYWSPRPSKSFDMASQLKMSIGTGLHYHMQNFVLGPMGVLYGSWVCTTEKQEKIEMEGYHPDPERAIWEIQAQKKPTWVFYEEVLWDGKFRIKGHTDGMISKKRLDFLSVNGRLLKDSLLDVSKRCFSIDDNCPKVCEIKSTGTFAFSGLNSVEKIPDYNKTQASIYQWLAKVDETVFVYIERDSLKMKSFCYSGTAGIVSDCKRKARIVWESIRDRKLPESAMACVSAVDKRAKTCAFREECWKSKFNFIEWVEKNIVIEECKGRKFLDLSKETYDV